MGVLTGKHLPQKEIIPARIAPSEQNSCIRVPLFVDGLPPLAHPPRPPDSESQHFRNQQPRVRVSGSNENRLGLCHDLAGFHELLVHKRIRQTDTTSSARYL